MKAPPAALLAATWLLGGCYFTSQVPPATLRAAGDGLIGPRLLRGPDETALLEPGTMVRARLHGGSYTGWVEAGALRTSAEGLLLGEPLRVAEVRALEVSDLDKREVQLLHETAPAGGSVGQSWRFSGRYQLKAPAPDAFAWARRFAERATAEGKAGGTWRMERGMLADIFDERAPVDAGDLMDVRDPGAAFAPGIRWRDVDQLELRSLSPEFSALTVPLWPLAVAFLALDGVESRRMTSATDGEPEGTLPMLTWNDPAARPLFTGRARRRAVVQPLATLDAQATPGGDLASGLSVGARFRNFYEMAVVGRGLALNGAGQRTGLLTAGFFMGLHVDGELAETGLAFALGAEVTGNASGATAVQLKWGPRLALGGGLFLTVSPFNVAGLSLPGPDGQNSTVTRVVSSLELGGTL